MRHMLSLLCLIPFVAACTPTLNARAVSYHNGLELGQGKQFAIVADGDQQNNLEFTHYAEMVNRQLHRHGLTQAPSLDTAYYRVQFRYDVDEGKQQIVSYPSRSYGGLGGYYGSGGYSGVGIGYSMPIYGNRVESYTSYTRVFEMEILRNDRSRAKVYQGRVTSRGENDSISAIAPCMIAALFENFPGVDGQEVSISLPYAACNAP